MKLATTTLLTAAAILALTGPASAATVLVSEGFGGDGTSDLAGTTADIFDAGITTAGGSNTWGGSLNVESDGLAYGNNAKVTYLNLGSYINDTKGTADGLFELKVTIADHPTQGGGGYDFLSFSNVSSPAAATTVHTVASVGTNGSGNSVAYGFGDIDLNVQTQASTSFPHTVTITLDLTATYYDNATQFGKITLSDSVEGELTSVILTADQSFAAIALIVDGTFVTRTGVDYQNLSLTQFSSEIPEPGSLALMGLGGLLIARRRRD